MKKLKLNLENLKVNSFETDSKKSKKGTLVGQWSYQYCSKYTCPVEFCSEPSDPPICDVHSENICDSQNCQHTGNNGCNGLIL